MARDLLLELGAEELPASFVRHALDVMQSTAEKLLAEARLPAAAIRTYGTPRRLALVCEGVPDAQPDRRETLLGPPKSAGVAPDGSFTKAAEGFAKKQGRDATALRVVDTPKGPYVAVDIEESGRPASDVLGPLLADLCARITFPKSMRWGEGVHAFGRPLHWIVALFGADVVGFSFADIPSGRSTRGHRFLAPATFDLADAGSYLDALRGAHVLPDFEERRATMRVRLEAAAAAAGGTLEPDAFLLDECLSLVEEPHVVPGTIDAAFLDLPDDVIVSVMRTHQRYFAVRKDDGRLHPTYLNVVNTANSPSTIARGNDRVLRARLNDAAFFVREDRKKGFVGEAMDTRLTVLDRVVFQQKLGSVGAKVRRVDEVARALAPTLPAADVSLAAKLAKTDLTTYIVSEFPELQGAMGRFYAKESGVDAAVADAIADHYKPAGAEDGLPASALASAVSVADRLDTLVGCFGIGLVPSGSADPFALRRAALSVVRIGEGGALDVDLRSALGHALDAYTRGPEAVTFPRPRPELEAALEEFVRTRIRAYARDRYPGDVVDAALAAWSFGSVRDLFARLEALDAFRAAPEYAALAVAFKRAFNLTKETVAGSVDATRLEDGAERDLHAALDAARGPFEAAVEARRYGDALAALGRTLRGPVDAYFEQVFVMVDDAALRENRLRLLRTLVDTVQRVVHFHLLSP